MKKQPIAPILGFFIILLSSSLIGYWFKSNLSLDQHARSLNPVIALQTSPLNINSWDSILRDVRITSETVQDDIALEQLVSEIRGLTQDLKRSKGIGRKMVLASIYKKQAAVIHYLEDILSGRAHSFGYQNKAAALLNSYRQSLIQVIYQYCQLEKDKRKKSRALYTALVARYLQGEKGSAITGWMKIKRYLPRALVMRSILAKSYISRRVQPSDRQIVAQARGQLSRSGSVAANLLLANEYARSKSLKYRAFLFAAMKKASSYPPQIKAPLFASAVGIWRKAEPRGSWRRPPMSLKEYSDLPAAAAIKERQAIALHLAGRTRAAINKYIELRSAFPGSKTLVEIDKRIVDLESVGFQRSGNVRPYERALVDAITRYNGEEILSSMPQAREAGKNYFKGKYRGLVFSLLAQAERGKTSQRRVDEAIRASLIYVQRTENLQDRVLVKERVAKIYAQRGQHGLAVKMYDHLMNGGDASKNLTYIKLAMASQRVLAKWPQSAPFEGIPKGPNEARVKLLSYYTKLQKQAGGMHWSVVSHIGLLNMALGDSDKAFQIWWAALKQNPKGQEAQQASGLMFIAYHKSEMWDQLEQLADLAIKSGLRPLGRGVKTPYAYLGDALFFGGKKAFAEKQFEKSWRKLQRFANQFKQDPRRDEGVFVLAHAYHYDKKHAESIETLVLHVTTYPSSPFHKKALLRGGDWSMVMAFEEQTIFFYQKFANTYENDAQSGRVRKALVSVYMGKELYGNAARIYRSQVESKWTNAETKVQSALEYMRIEEKYGSIEDAVWGASNAISLSKDPLTVSKVLAFQARRVTLKSKDAKSQLHAIAAQAKGLEMADPLVVENVGEVLYLLAGTYAIDQKDEVFNIGIENHSKALEQYYSAFFNAKKHYEAVCDLGENSFCAPSMNRLAAMTNFSIQTIQDINIQEILDAKTVSAFKTRKARIIASLSQIAIKASQTATKLASQGKTTPQHASDIIQENSNTWDLDQADEVTGNSYTQWSTGSVKE